MTRDGPLRTGDTAPDFTLATATGENGQPLQLPGPLRGRLVLLPKRQHRRLFGRGMFVPRQLPGLPGAGAEVIGISTDSSDSHRRFAERLNLPFILLSDPDGSVRQRYRVPKTFGIIPGRTTFLIDKNGIIQRVFSSQFQPAKHVSEALAALRKLRASNETHP